MEKPKLYDPKDYEVRPWPLPDAEAIAWLRNRPKCIHQNLINFPPGALVKGTRELRCPMPGKFGFVYSWTENGKISVVGEAILPSGEMGVIRAYCDPEWLEVVSFHKGIDSQVVAGILRGGH